jgi:hypothetical protein
MTFPLVDKAALVEECLGHLGTDKNVIPRATHVLELVAHSSVGLGEVLQDYAHQAWDELRHVISAAQHKANGTQSVDDTNMLENAQMILKTVRTVLEMTPIAMQRNKAETIGEEKLSMQDIAQVANAFAHAPYIEPLLIAS